MIRTVLLAAVGALLGIYVTGLVAPHILDWLDRKGVLL